MKKEFKVISELILQNSKVLDVGCGDGELMKFLKDNKTSKIRGLEISKNLIIWNLNQGQINSLEFSFWSLNKLLIGISIIFIIIILAYLLRFYRFKLGTDLPQLPSK